MSKPLSNSYLCFYFHGNYCLKCGLYYKSFMIVIYDRNDSGQYYESMITIVIYDPSLSSDHKLQS
jgi:hypothetical protein